MFIYLYTETYPDDVIPIAQRPTNADDPEDLSPYLAGIRLPPISSVAKPHSTRAQSASIPLMNNVMVYAIAHKYEIPLLKELALLKFRCLMKDWPQKDFAGVIAKVFEATPPDDQGLRDVIIKICSKHLKDVLDNSETAAIIQQTAPLSFGIVKRNQQIRSERAEAQEKTIENFQANHRATTAKLNDLENTLKEKESALQAATRAREKLVTDKWGLINTKNQAIKEAKQSLLGRLDHFLKGQFDWQECRNNGCSGDFDGYLERYGSDDDFRLQLRCSQCRCRHDIGAAVSK